MSFLPSILAGSTKNSRRTTGAAFEGSVTLPCIHDDQPPANKPKTGTPQAPKMSQTSLTGAKMSSFQSCHSCGREFGSASIGIQEKQCHRKVLQTEKGAAKDRELLPKVITRHKVEVSTSWEPFSCECQYCGGKYGRHSILMHENRCPHKQQTTQRGTAVSSSQDWEGDLEKKHTQALLVNELLLLPRPKTRTLTHSTMAARGHIIPSIDDVCYSTIVCRRCGEDVPADRALVHDKSCSGRSRTMNTGAVTFPMLPQVKIRVDEDTSGNSRKATKKPPTIVCYICGREYGSKSISIHEPQCLKKWQVKNSKLPISQRKALPKKTIHNTTVARVVSVEDTQVIKGHELQGSYSGKILHEIVDNYFQYCYDEFERELQPCSKCGRTFAPERLVKHVGKCNAKPLKKR